MMRLAIGADSGLFRGTIVFESFLSLLLVAMNAELTESRDKDVTNPSFEFIDKLDKDSLLP